MTLVKASQCRVAAVVNKDLVKQIDSLVALYEIIDNLSKASGKKQLCLSSNEIFHRSNVYEK